MELYPLKKIKEFHLFRPINALWIALIGGILFTAVMSLSHLNEGWVLDEGFYPLLSLVTNVLLLFLVLIYVFDILRRDIPKWKKYVLGIGGALLIVSAFSVISFFLRRWIYEEMQLPDTININLLKNAAVAFVAIALTFFLYHISLRQQMNMENERLKSENLMMRLEAFESQMNPHFLFNSLNTLSGLIDPDNQPAQQYLQQLASTYRYIIRNQRLVTLNDEMRFVDSYCLMMQTRYGDNLKVERRIDPSFLSYYVIPISLQLLIENALKHNVVSDRYPLTVTIETLPSSTHDARIRVSNIVRPKQEMEQGNGVGLVNLSKRYMLLCDKDITITNKEGVFAVDIPLLATDPLDHQRKKHYLYYEKNIDY